MKELKLAAVFLLLFTPPAFAEDSEAEFRDSPRKKNYYVKSRGYSSNPESDPPSYARQLDETGIEAFNNIDWIDAGLTYRARFEHRDNDFRRSTTAVDNPLLLRTQAYFGIKNILDPLRFAIELQDSRRHNSQFDQSVGDVNKIDLFQGYGELYFKNPTILDRPISLRYGRMAFEVMDRKMIARDDWGNSGTNFEGFRNTIGTKENDWQLDGFAMKPIVKSAENNDYPDKNKWIYGGILNWRRWSETITIQPFYLQMNQKKTATILSSQINSPGFRLYGDFHDSKFDYDLIGIYQFGESDEKPHRANAYAAEVGYTQDHKWKPRYSLVYGYASGDKNPNDGKNQRFERFYGFNRAWSNSNTIEWENLKTIKSRVELSLNKKLRFESSYSHY